MVSFKSDGSANGTINSTTKALASCGGNEVTNVSLSIKEADGCTVSCNGDTLTLTGVPTGTDTNNFTVVLEATGTYGNYTDTAELKYTVKKWFGEPSTVQVHLNNADTPVPTDSNGNYPEDVVRTATLTASSGTSVVNITSVQSQVSGVTATLNDSSLKVTVPTTVTGWSNDVLTVPIVCTLADGYPAQTVSMSFYKVRAAKDAEYPDVYDLLVTPSSLLVSVDQETGKAKYPVMSIIPCISQYSASGAEKGLTVQQFNQLGVGKVSYNFDGETDSDGSVKFTPLTQDSIYVSNNQNT
jgi:hypothetical protein